MRPPPGIFWLIKRIPGPNEVIGRRQIIGRVGHNRTPSVESRTSLEGPHHTQLKPVPDVLLQNPYPAKVTRIADMVDGITPAKATGSALWKASHQWPQSNAGIGALSKKVKR